jgi:uncharacterized protein (TIGR03435 family)
VEIRYSACLAYAVMCGSASIVAQGNKTPALPAAKFEVVSIRPSNPKSGYGQPEILPDGYRFHGMGLWRQIADAYFPRDLQSPDRVQGEPSWASTDKYDIDARVSRADLADWQNPAKQPAMLQAMLRSMLAERLKLAVHHVPAEIPGYALVVAKSGPRLKTSPAGEVFPSGTMKLPDGAEVVPYRPGERHHETYYGASMEDLAHWLTGKSFNHPVLDKTGLTGRYDFVLEYRSLEAGDMPVIVRPDDPDPLASWNMQALGLKLILTKIPTENLVIDHIERPSPN